MGGIMARVSTPSNKKQQAQLLRWAEELAQLVRESQMSELRLEQGNQSLRIRRNSEAGERPAAPVSSEAAPRPSVRGESLNEDFGTPVSSNFVGVFRSSHPKTGK